LAGKLAFLPAILLAFVMACRLASMTACWLTDVRVCRFASCLAFLPVCLLAVWPTFRQSVLKACKPDGTLAIRHDVTLACNPAVKTAQLQDSMMSGFLSGKKARKLPGMSCSLPEG
jgi:hypothetical protein